MAAPPRQPLNMEQFEVYFQMADLDRDGRVSGAEAVAFFQGSDLPKNVLAQIWTYSDTKNSGFLGREEFYNALKLVTVAQTGRQLTRDIVMSALGPASSKIPAPRIRVTPASAALNSASSRPPMNPTMLPAQVGSVAQSPSQTNSFHGATGLGLPHAGVSQQPNRPETMRSSPLHPIQSNNQVLPAGGSMTGQATNMLSPAPIESPVLPRGGNNSNPRPPSTNPNLSADWFSGQMGGGSSDGRAPQISDRSVNAVAKQDGFGPAYPVPTISSGVGSLTTVTPSASLPPKPPGPTSSSSLPANKSVTTANGFGGDAFSATQTKQDVFSSLSTTNKVPGTSSMASVTVGFQTPVMPVQAVLPSSTSTAASFTFPAQTSASSVRQSQLGAIPPAASGVSGTSVAQSQWPKMTKSDIQKYVKVFVEVDKDRDGKITGEEARNLFLSWRLPREILKQVWDLSDQDGDSMLSLKEFCIALYLMERYREGRPLPPTLPNSVMFDDALLQTTTQPLANYGASPYQPSPGSQQGLPGIRPQTRPGLPKPPQQARGPTQVDIQEQPIQKKSTVPVLDKHLLDQLSNEEQSTLSSKLKEATDADKKVQDLEKEITEAKEKIEFYRAKMQELVLYKSRCDTRLIEVTEMSSSNKREYEGLAKKYEEKCRQVGDVASKLTIEEATFREIQERKLKLYNAIVKLDGGNAENTSKAQAEHIQSDLEELVKSLNDRCKQYGLRAKPTTLVELPFGWQHGIQQGAADWDEDWDKFEEEGFQLVKELSVDVQNVIAAPKSKSPSISNEDTIEDVASQVKTSDDQGVEKRSTNNELDAKSEVADAQSDNLEIRTPSSPGKGSVVATSPPGIGIAAPSSPPGSTIKDIPSPKFDSLPFRMDDASPHASPQAKDLHREQDVIESNRSEISWGPSFDVHEDAESVWNFDSFDKAPGLESKVDDHLFGGGDFGLNPIKTGPSSGAYDFGKESSFFADSVPTTPPANDFTKEKNSFFADSVPATPFYNSVFSPRFNDAPGMGSPGMSKEFRKDKSFFADSVPGTPQFNSVFSPRFGEADRSFDSFSRFDSFNAQGNLSRFDSFNAQPNLSRFDSMGSTAAYDSGNFFPQNDSFARFDSMRSTRDSDHSHGFMSFDDSDPFGSGPFKPSDGNTPKQSTDRWSAF